MRLNICLASAVVFALSACGGAADTDSPEALGAAEEVVAIPESLAPFGDGYPGSGDPCRRLGESAATSNYLDDSALLLGCPSEASAAALGGKEVGNIDGIRLVSVPMGDVNAGMPEMVAPVGAAVEDALVPGTNYHATTWVPCGFGGAPPTSNCDAGVIRNWGDDGTALVEVTKPDGLKRAIYFNGTKPFGADGAEADGSAGWDFTTTWNGDEVTIRFGPETYVVVAAFIVGG